MLHNFYNFQQMVWMISSFLVCFYLYGGQNAIHICLLASLCLLEYLCMFEGTESLAFIIQYVHQCFLFLSKC
uniref:Uncharacterized protein n=1 Tax=Rhizophora mucronata TaxID=61149 RepID=A0A2P2P8G1_RHIMU